MRSTGNQTCTWHGQRRGHPRGASVLTANLVGFTGTIGGWDPSDEPQLHIVGRQILSIIFKGMLLAAIVDLYAD